MAFLDNSGDIILDAVLTEAGRRKMAQGNFQIDRFALGDDEIDYSLYDKNHASGSAYYDLEILQTPVFEAFTQINAGINYGLLPFENTDLLYLPEAKANEKTVQGLNNIVRNTNVFYVTDTSGDNGTNQVRSVLSDNDVKYLASTSNDNNYVLVEVGLNTGINVTPNGTKAERDSYLVANNLIDRSFNVYYDSRFFNACYGPTPGRAGNQGSYFKNDAGDDGTSLNFSFAHKKGTPISAQIGIENYAAARISAVANEIYWNSPSFTDQAISTINGPRSVVTTVNLVVKSGLSAEYSLYGKTSQSLFSKTMDYIDTTGYVVGTTTQAQVQLPMRILKLT